MVGEVFIVGGGPGDPKLLTIKAMEVLSEADVVVYDHLIDDSLLDFCKKEVELIYVGKEAGRHTLSQEGINKLLVDKAKEGKRVVRLKGGDPYIFGRGGEEAEILAKNNIKFQVIPGISAGIAISAYTGIPLTHRRYASYVTFLTGHEDPTKDRTSIDWELLGKSRGTLVFFMGVKRLKQICDTLIRYGMDKNRPACLVMWGTTCKQRTVVSTLEEISDVAKREGFAPPSILIIGEVVRLREDLNWFEKLPLLGKGIVITRARAQASVLKEKLEALGACCIEFPTIKIVPLDDYSHLFSQLENISLYKWVVFTSANGVRHFFDRIAQNKMDARILHGVKVAAIGPATAKQLERRGIIADFIPHTYIAEEVAEGISNQITQGEKVLIIRAKEAREVLVEMLKKRGARVDVVAVYETVLENQHKTELIEHIENGVVQMVTFTSSSTVKNFFKLIPPSFIRSHENIKFASIGPITASTLEEFGFKSDVIPEKYTIDGLVDAIKEYFRK